MKMVVVFYCNSQLTCKEATRWDFRTNVPDLAILKQSHHNIIEIAQSRKSLIVLFKGFVIEVKIFLDTKPGQAFACRS